MASANRVLCDFDGAARSYDRLVGANPGYHRDLDRAARSLRLADGGRGARLLDVGCGTGASTAALLKAAGAAEIVGIDGSAQMLAEARRKQWPDSVSFVHTALEEAAATGVTGPFDGVLGAYLVRNLPDPDAGLRALRQLLRPGAPIALHEYSVRDTARAKLVWTAVCWTVIIPAGRIATGTGGLYRYLWRSVRDFDRPARFENRLRRAGFEQVRCTPVPGWQRGITHTFTARRPEGAR